MHGFKMDDFTLDSKFLTTYCFVGPSTTLCTISGRSSIVSAHLLRSGVSKHHKKLSSTYLTPNYCSSISLQVTNLASVSSPHGSRFTDFARNKTYMWSSASYTCEASKNSNHIMDACKHLVELYKPFDLSSIMCCYDGARFFRETPLQHIGLPVPDIEQFPISYIYSIPRESIILAEKEAEAKKPREGGVGGMILNDGTMSYNHTMVFRAHNIAWEINQMAGCFPQIAPLKMSSETPSSTNATKQSTFNNSRRVEGKRAKYVRFAIDSHVMDEPNVRPHSLVREFEPRQFKCRRNKYN